MLNRQEGTPPPAFKLTINRLAGQSYLPRLATSRVTHEENNVTKP